MEKYIVTTDKLIDLCKSFHYESENGLIQDEKSYIETWLQTHDEFLLNMLKMQNDISELRSELNRVWRKIK